MSNFSLNARILSFIGYILVDSILPVGANKQAHVPNHPMHKRTDIYFNYEDINDQNDNNNNS